ncbi:MAG: hypothetical protein ACRD0K_16730 [Egibacteraceae bacterium]
MSAVAADPSRVWVTADRYTLWPPCACPAPIVLAREVTDLQLIQRVACQTCRQLYQVTFVADRRHGLAVCWRPARRRP